MAAAGWTGTQGEDLNGQPAERSSVLQEGFGVLPSVWDPMRDDMPAETASGGKEKPARRFWPVNRPLSSRQVKKEKLRHEGLVPVSKGSQTL